MTAHLLVQSRVGDAEFARLTPEGFEDIDCVSPDGSLTLIQVKEKGAGAGRMAAAAVAEALAHASESHRTTGAKSIVLVTDGELGSGLKFTGWELTIRDASPTAAALLHQRLIAQGLSAERAADIIHTSRIVQLPWNLRVSSEQLLRDELGLHAAVASLVVSELHSRLSKMAANQRLASLESAQSLDLADLDSLITNVQSSVDISGLDAAVSSGVCAPADFITPSALGADQFYLGVDGAPAHVAAGLDVLRPREMTLMIEAAQKERYVLLSGPSGSGKSVLLWRAARDAVLGSRVIRVQRVKSDADVELLRRHVQLAGATELSPVIVVADNLGRPHMDRWPDAVDRLRELPFVILFGACRAEDFHPRLARGSARIVQPTLDETTAQHIAERLALTGLTQAMAPLEAFQRSDGLLMEYLALLLRGQRLSLIIAEQAAHLSEPGRELQRSAARLISVAHSLGFSIKAKALGSLLLPGTNPDRVGDALNILRGEHIVILDGTSWRGLHELRSRTLADALHESPPPTFGDTLCAVTGCLSLGEASWLLRRTAEQFPQWAPEVAKSLGEHIASPEINDAGAMAEVLEGAERADNMIYAQSCLPALHQRRPQGLTVAQAAPLAYGIRNQNLYRQDSSSFSRQIVGSFRSVTSAMPDRRDDILTLVTSGLTSDRISSLASTNGLANFVRLVEAVGEKISFNDEEVTQILASVSLPNDRQGATLWARLVEALYVHLSDGNIESILGTMRSRSDVIARTEPWAINLEIDADGPSVTVFQALTVENIGDELPWESPGQVSNDVVEGIAIALAKRLACACPDAQTVTVRTISPTGRPLEIDGFDFAQRAIPTASFPSRTGVRRNVGFSAAIRRLTSADTWTEALTAQVELALELTTLADAAVNRLNPHDNSRRRGAWIAQIDAAKLHAALLKPEPPTRDPGLPESHAIADSLERESGLRVDALDKVAQALASMTTNTNLAAVSMNFEDAARKLTQARITSTPVLTGLGEPASERLINRMVQLAGLSAAAHYEPSRLSTLALRNDNAVQEFINDVFCSRADGQVKLIDDLLREIPGRNIHVFPDPTQGHIVNNGIAVLSTVPVDSVGAGRIVSRFVG
ncbi:hypothetical protein [Arthrobacter sp. ERGS1:01]|uniref:hypothetical protein n=1 Tax=Arthrobacter sp. ERGS1:01 TaxID=1704044 RepID=UPI0012375A6F|nr:hypothetical protein [Arthrobacter sp. ERGS1:01]